MADANPSATQRPRPQPRQKRAPMPTPKAKKDPEMPPRLPTRSPRTQPIEDEEVESETPPKLPLRTSRGSTSEEKPDEEPPKLPARQRSEVSAPENEEQTEDDDEEQEEQEEQEQEDEEEETEPEIPSPRLPNRTQQQQAQLADIGAIPQKRPPMPLSSTSGLHARKIQQKRSAFPRSKRQQNQHQPPQASPRGVDDAKSGVTSNVGSSTRKQVVSVDQAALQKHQQKATKKDQARPARRGSLDKGTEERNNNDADEQQKSKGSNATNNTNTTTNNSTYVKTSSSSSASKKSGTTTTTTSNSSGKDKDKDKEHGKKESSSSTSPSSSSQHKKKKRHHKAKEEEDDQIAEPLFFDPDGTESLLSIIGRLDTNSSGKLIRKMKELNNIKRKISTGSKRNFLVEGDLAGLDKKIAVLIRNRISLDEILSSKGDITENLKELTVLIKDPSQRELYGRMFYLLQRHPEYMAHLAGSVKLAEIDPLLQTVMFTLYGNQYEEDEEHLLLTMFRTVMQAEFGRAMGINELFRSNSALTRMLTTYTRRSAGQQFLKTTFKDILGEIAADKTMNLEITPNKVFDEYVNDYEVRNGQPYEGTKKLPTEECAKMPFIQEIIRPRIPVIERYISRFIDQYERNLNLVPYGIRWICKQVKLIVLEKWPESDWRQVCSMIGGFFVLRFINPAIITPAAYMILEQTPGPTARRNLTVLAKIQQNLSNCTRFSDVKEPYMTPLNYIFDKHSDRFLHFLDALTEVDDLDHHLSLDKYVYLTKFTKEQLITISLNEMYLIHSLLIKYRSALVPASASLAAIAEDPLLKILDLMPEAPQQLPRAENFEVELKLIAPEAKEGFGDEQLKQVAPERLFSETKYYLFNVIRKLPAGMKLKNDLVIPLLNQISSILTSSMSSSSSGSSSSSTTKHLITNIKKIIANLHQLESLDVTSEADNFLILRQDLSNDITNISSRIKRVEGDISRLRIVLKALDDQYKSAQAQIDTYRQYLDNVRQTVSGSSGKPAASAGVGSGSSSNNNSSSSSSSSSGSSKKDKDPRLVTVSLASLIKDKIIVATPALTAEKLSAVNVQFFMVSPGIFDVSIIANGHEQGKEKLLLDELLENQANGHQTESTDVMEYNVNLMIYFINKKFVIKAHK